MKVEARADVLGAIDETNHKIACLEEVVRLCEHVKGTTSDPDRLIRLDEAIAELKQQIEDQKEALAALNVILQNGDEIGWPTAALPKPPFKI